MKRFNSKFLAFFSVLGFLSVFAISLTSCDGVIFDEIRKEVELADAKISGDIQNIVRYTYKGEEHVFVSTGEIYHRSVEDSVVDSKFDFSDFSTPSGYVYGLAADKENLYAISITIEKDDDGYNMPTKRTLYCYEDGWKEIWSAEYSSSKHAIIFCTNAPQPDHRRAFFRHGSDVWELSGAIKLTSEMVMTEIGTTNNTTIPTASSRRCTYLNGDVYFSNYAITSNETADSDATIIYRSDGGDNVYYSKNGTDWTNVDLSCSTIVSLAVTSDYLLAGTDSGIVHTKLTSGIPSSGNESFSTNADSTLSSYYEIPAILVINPALSETSGTIYASSITSSSSASLNNVGLWSYYASENEWNRE